MNPRPRQKRGDMTKKLTAILALTLLVCSVEVTTPRAARAQQGDDWNPWGVPKKAASANPGDGTSKDKSGLHPLSNDSIVKLVKAGLGEDTIISMVNTQPGRYSLGPDDIIALKQAGVSAKVINAMVGKVMNTMVDESAGGSAHAPADTPEAAAKTDPPLRQSSDWSRPVPNEAGLYAVVSSGNLEHIVGRVTSFERSGSLLGSAVTAGIHAARINTQIPGSHARITVGAKPVFYYRTSESQDVGGLDLVLTSMTVKAGRRQFEVGARGSWRASTGVSVRHQINYDASEIAPGLYKLNPTQELEDGEYAFYMLRGRERASVSEGQGFVFDFQVE